MSSFARQLSYVRRVPFRYLAGGVTTLLYAALAPQVPLKSRDLILQVEQGHGMEAVTQAAWILLGVAFGVGALRFASRFVLFRAARQLEFELRNDLCAHLQSLPETFFTQNRTGDLMSRAVNDVNSVRLFLGMGLMHLIQTPILYATMTIAMVAIDWRVTAWILTPYLLFLPFGRVIGRRMHAASLAVQEQLGELSTVVQENASGVLVVRAYAMEEAERERFQVENQVLYKRHLRLAWVEGLMQPVIMTLPALSLVALVWVGGQAVLAGRIGIADFITFFLILVQLSWPTLMMGWLIAIAQRGLAGFQRIAEVLDTVPAIRDRADVAKLTELQGNLQVRGLTLDYGLEGLRPALDQISLDAESGQTIGIVGSVGSGKSTLVQAIPRLLDVPEGQIFLDGVDLVRVPLQLLRRSIAMVPQESFLFSTTIADNIAFGRPDSPRDEIVEAARRADVLADIEALPHGFDTVVGERGVTLSGGQRQRVALARALLLRPKILILDDALSNVDAATEESILKELRLARHGRTSFIVAHRISAVRDADQIIVLEEGRLVENGRHDALVAAGGVYAKLARRQQLEQELEGELAVQERAG